jgi:hypothetical protein
LKLTGIRAKAVRIYSEYRAILIFLNHLTLEERRAIDVTIEGLPSLPRAQIISFLEKLTPEIQSLRAEYGIKAKLKDFEFFLKPKDITLHPGKVLLVSKHHLSELIPKYEKVFSEFLDLPPHARIGIDTLGHEYPTPRFEVHLLEASLFEDMAALWNDIADISPEFVDGPLRDIYGYKRTKALLRATIRSAFALIEGYLNGLAMDIYLTRKCSPKQLEQLTEADQESGRPKPLSLKDKISQYPKIALSRRTPPITATSCREVAQLLDLEAQIRHALIHPTPMARGPASARQWREETYFEVTRSQVADACRIVTDVILAIDRTLDGMFGTVTFWLYPKESGHYPDETFH